MTDTLDDRAQAGPTDREVVALLQRLASARAQLLQAEHAAQAEPVVPRAGHRNPDVENAHTELLWAQAQVITSQREGRAQKALEQAQTRERQALRRHGYTAFRDYLTERTNVPPAAIHLEVARKEFSSAQADWDAIQRELAAVREADTGATVVIDLTGDEPRRIA